MIRRAKSSHLGFTLVELMFAMAFVSFIIIFAVTAVIQVMGTYNKGLAVKQINQAGRSTLEDISRYVRTVDPGAINVDQVANGRVCFGGVSYVWNKWDTASSSAHRYDDDSPLTFARVDDRANSLCNPSGPGLGYVTVVKADATDILSSNVWVLDIAITKSATNPLVDISLQLGAANDPTISGGKCTVGGAAGQFCATSSFKTTVMSGGGN